MKEDFLHFVWRHKRIDVLNLFTEQNQKLEVLQFGDYLQTSGPDFFNAKLVIDHQIWVGNVEMHLNASDWYAHKHETDLSYDNVILHVVWNYDVDVFRKDGSVIPVLNISKYVEADLVLKYQKLQTHKQWILCENNINEIESFTWLQWKEKLIIERLELKAQPILKLLKETNNNWEEVLFILLAKNFGLNINGVNFEQTAQIISFNVIRKERFSDLNLEALLFGVSGLLNEPKDDVYFKKLKNEYLYLQTKHQITNQANEKIQFFKLRPDNFPTIRLSQLANLFHTKENLFSELIENEKSLVNFYLYFNVHVSEYWQTHYVFDKESIHKTKKVAHSFIDLLLINTILPLRFIYFKAIGKDDFESILETYQEIKSENNTIINKFKALKIPSENAYDSQALIHLNKNYCDVKKCLHCMIGVTLLKKNM